MDMKLTKEDKRFNKLQQTYSSSLTELYNKLTGSVVGECYKVIPIEDAKSFAERISQNKTDFDLSLYIKLNLKYYEKSDTDLSLTREEKLTLKLIDQVIFI